ncbi:uncharacterized protein fam83ha [Eucyclogobius newberryi]|uniref:uncharacterized protein fam83ha n=1 Tax=Eucyclogobius newberryi TaxID=166745 RepID=UPI003B5AFB67
MARRSQCSESGDNPLDPNYLPAHYREEYRLAIDALIEEDLDGYYKFLQLSDVVDFLAPSEIEYIQNSIQLPKQSALPDNRYLDTGDGSSDTYWPMHSDLDAPGLDLGWPQTHHFIGPTEVTTLVNPAAPDMPSIKEQARRLIKNAQMVIAVVMDVFSDVDIFADILNAAMRNVAVYLLLDEANVQDFIKMVNNCRVNLEAIQFLRVRTVSGISYHCRTGKSFKGQMLDRFILTDCRAVLSGNYSFMWSYEKLHRCMAHLFLGQLVSTFDEEFRILFAQSEPLDLRNMEDLTVLPKHPGDRPMLRGKYGPGQAEEWNRPTYEENRDWRGTPVKRQTFHGPLDIYNRYPSPQSRLDPQTRLEPPFDQGPPRIMDKIHSFGEGGPGRYSLPYQQPGLPEIEPPGRPFYRGQQHLPSGNEPDYGGQMDKFWNQDFQQEEPYPDQGYPRQIDPQNFDPLSNYFSSTRNTDVEQSSDKLIPGPDLPHATTHSRRHIGQTYACQTSPTPSNTTEKKFMPDHSSDRKDPTVKKGLRNWRISSYLSACDLGEPEGLPMGQGQDPFDDYPHPTQQPTPPPPQAADLAVSKIPNVREYKVPALPRASQMLAYGKMTHRDLSKKQEIPQIMVHPEPKAPTPTPSDSSSTTDGEKQEEVEPRDPITSVLRRDGKYNPAVQRISRLKSSFIFTSLNQDNSEQEDDKSKTESDQTKLPYGSQRRSGPREPFEWRSYIKSSDNAKTEEDTGKQAEKDSENKLQSLSENLELAKSTEAKTKGVAKSPEVTPKVDNIEVEPKRDQPPLPQPSAFLLNESFLDMNDPNQRLLFFKELAAKRRAEKAAEEAKLKQISATKEKKEEQKEEEQVQNGVAGSKSETSKEDSKKIDAKSLGLTEEVDREVKEKPSSTQIQQQLQTNAATDSEKVAFKQSQPSQPASTEKLTHENQAPQRIDAPKLTEKQDKPKETNKASLPADVKQVTVENKPADATSDATSKESQVKDSSSLPDVTKALGMDQRLPSARIYERSQSQEANKEAIPKSRLWTPSIHRREFLKPFGDKQKITSTVIQIEEATEETSPTVESDASKEHDKVRKLEIDDETEIGQVSKQSEREEIAKGKQTQMSKKDDLKSSGTEIKIGLEKPSPPQSELSSQDKPKIEPKQPIDPSGNVKQVEEGARKSTDQENESQNTSEKVEPQKQDETAEKIKNTEDQNSTKVASLKDVAKTIEKPDELPPTSGKATPATSGEATIDKNVQVATSSSKDDAKEVNSVEKKASIATQEVVDKSNLQKDVSVIEEKAGRTLSSDKTEPVSLFMDESKQKYPITYTEEVPSLESHSNTSSPASFATALEFISSEESDMFSPSRNDPQHLFKSGNLESSLSDMSDFATPNSEISMSPMPSTLDMDDTFEDNVSIAETVIEASSRRKVATTKEVKGPKSNESEPQQDRQPTETSFGSLNSATAQLEDRVGTTQLTKAADVTERAAPTQNEAAKSNEHGKLKDKMVDSAELEIQEESNTQIEVNSAIGESPSPAASQVEQETKAAEKATEMTAERNTKDTLSNKVKTQGLTGHSEASAVLSKDSVSSPATSEEKTKMTTEDALMSTERSKESVDVKSLDPKVSTIKSEAETSSTNVTKDTTTEDEGSEIGSKDGEFKYETKTKKVQMEPSDALSATEASTVASKVAKEVNTGARTTEIKEESKPMTEETCLQSTTEGVGPNVQESESEAKPVKSPTNNDLSKVETKASPATQETVDKTSEITTHEASAATGNVAHGKGGSKTVMTSNASEVNQSSTSPINSEVKKETKSLDNASATTKDVSKSAETTNINTQKDSSNETAPTDGKSELKTEISSGASETNQSTSSATSETTAKTSDKESKTVNKEMSKSASGENEQKSKDTNDNTKENTSVSESASSAAQPKQSSKSRYLTSTANVISCSNLRDDTKILLEQISANSQTRNESSPAKEAPVTDDEKEDEADKNAKRKNDLRSSLGQQKTSQERDKLLERIQTMRKDRKVYSRFEV